MYFVHFVPSHFPFHIKEKRQKKLLKNFRVVGDKASNQQGYQEHKAIKDHLLQTEKTSEKMED